MIRAYHVKLEREKDSRDVAASILSAIGGEALLARAQAELREKLEPFGLIVPFPVYPDNVEVVLTSDAKVAAVIRAIDHPREAYVEIALVSQDADVPDLANLANSLSLEVHTGCIESAREIERLSKRLGELSPNGRLLADSDNKKVFQRLAQDQLREDLSAIVNALGGSPITSDLLKQHEAFKDRVDQLEATLSDSDLAAKQFIIYCGECGVQHLAFQSLQRARSVLSEVDSRCVSCGQPGLDVVESYTLSEIVVKGLQQGLWLESLASEVMSRRCDAVWSGQMVNTNEVDVLGVHLGATVLVECKDTSFGQNELYVAAMKAQDLGADTVIIATTRDVHPNVLEAKDRLENWLRGRRPFTILSGQTAETFERGIDSALSEIEERFLKQFSQPESMGSSWARWTPGGFIRIGV